MNIYGEEHLPQLLFVHGGGVGPWMWDNVIKELTPYFQCIVVTLPYHSLENNNDEQYYDGPFTIESYSVHLLKQLKAVRNTQPIGVVGFSLGAQMTLELLSLAPTMFKFAMINSGLCISTGVSSGLIKAMLALSAPLAKMKSFAKLQAKTLYIPEQYFETYFSLSKAISIQQLTEIMDTNMSYRLKPAFKQTTANVHITYGSKENRAIKNSAIEISQHLPHAATFVVPKVGHGYPFAEPVHFAHYIKQHF